MIFFLSDICWNLLSDEKPGDSILVRIENLPFSQRGQPLGNENDGNAYSDRETSVSSLKKSSRSTTPLSISRSLKEVQQENNHLLQFEHEPCISMVRGNDPQVDQDNSRELINNPILPSPDAIVPVEVSNSCSRFTRKCQRRDRQKLTMPPWMGGPTSQSSCRQFFPTATNRSVLGLRNDKKFSQSKLRTKGKVRSTWVAASSEELEPLAELKTQTNFSQGTNGVKVSYMCTHLSSFTVGCWCVQSNINLIQRPWLMYCLIRSFVTKENEKHF